MKALLTVLVLIAATLPVKAETSNICDRTPEVRDAILQATSADDDCAAVNLASVTETLSLHGKQLTSLKAGDFDGLGNLRTLLLGENRLTTLPVRIFAGLGSLETLGLRGHQNDMIGNQLTVSLTTLPAGVFDGLGSLQVLLLQYNELTTLPEGVFDGLENLEYLGFEGGCRSL